MRAERLFGKPTEPPKDAPASYAYRCPTYPDCEHAECWLLVPSFHPDTNNSEGQRNNG